MNNKLALSYHNKTPLVVAIIAAVSGVFFLVLSILSGGTGLIYIADFIALSGAAALIFTMAKRDTRYMAIPNALIAVVSIIIAILFAVNNAHYLLLGANAVLWYGVSLLNFAVLAAACALSALTAFGLLNDKRFSYYGGGALLITATIRFILVALMLSKFDIFKVQTLIEFLAEAVLAAYIVWLALAMQNSYIAQNLSQKHVFNTAEIFPVKVCNNCGKRYTNAEMAFCKDCGARLDDIPSDSPLRQGKLLCENCGFSTNNEEMVFCPECGKQLFVNAAKPAYKTQISQPVIAPDLAVAANAQPKTENVQFASKISSEPTQTQTMQAQPTFTATAPRAQATEIVRPVVAVNEITPDEAATRLEKLHSLLEKGIITQDEYDEKRKELIKYL